MHVVSSNVNRIGQQTRVMVFLTLTWVWVHPEKQDIFFWVCMHIVSSNVNPIIALVGAQQTRVVLFLILTCV